MDYSLREIARICGGEFAGLESRAQSVMTDSRHSFSGHERPLFVAMQGLNHDGHAFIGELYGRGVRAFLVEKPVDVQSWPGAGFVLVKSSIRALQAHAADYRNSFKGIMVGITGSAGKTTVKEWIARLAPAGKKIFRSPRSYNSQSGVPLSILMMRGDEDIALIEAGISRPGEMEPLARIIRPDVGIFTALGAEHSENFSSDEHKAREKTRLFAACSRVIYDGTPLVGAVLAEAAPAAELIKSSTYVDPALSHDGKVSGMASMVAAFWASEGFPVEDISARLMELESVSMRLDIREGLAGSVIIADWDNAGVDSLAIALDYIGKAAAGKPRMVILSDILFSSLPEGELYHKVASLVRAASVERFIGVGERLHANSEAFGVGREVSQSALETGFYRSAGEFLDNFKAEDIAGYAVLVKGNQLSGFGKILHRLERKTHTTVLEIDLDAMAHNLDCFRRKAGAGTKIMAMVKASGYGNGGFEVAGMLQGRGVDYLAVAFADEGMRLREGGITMPIVVLNADSDSFELMVAGRLEPEIYNMASLEAFIAAVRESGAGNYPIHIKIDSGMHRLGFEQKDISALVSTLRGESGTVDVRSLFSHLAAADVAAEDDFTHSQIELFDRLSRQIAEGIGYMPLRHIAASAAVERLPEAKFDMVRLGIGLYGISACNSDNMACDSALRSISRLTTRIVQTRELTPGETVGYGRAGVISRPTRVAVIPVGYADGLDRRLGEGCWSVEIAGRPCPTVGRISMDNCVVDITGVDAAEGSPVMVFGGGGSFGVEEMARRLGTIPYEIMTSVSERVRRIFIKE